jgi:hypothetical protein
LVALGGCNAPGRELLVRNPIAARFAARRAIVEPITAQANVDLSLAGATVLFTIALVFCHVALHAVILGLGAGGHKRTLARVEWLWKVPLVTGQFEWILSRAFVRQFSHNRKVQLQGFFASFAKSLRSLRFRI